LQRILLSLVHTSSEDRRRALSFASCEPINRQEPLVF